jgi:arylsulfatase A-like enzyme
VRLAWASWVARAAAGLLVGSAARLAWIEGGGADARIPPPSADSLTAPTDAPAALAAHGSPSDSGVEPPAKRDAYEVKMRLVEALGDAVIDVPSLAAAQPYFQAHWRKLRGPWLRLVGVAGQLVTTIALRTTTQDETQWAVSAQAGTWAPDVRVWNMNEGSFDQREAIYAPTPSTITFRMMLPGGARLRFCPAVATPLQATTVFDVSLVDAAGDTHAISEARILSRNDRQWLDLEADLAPWSGQMVELSLRTTTTTASEKRPPVPSSADPASDDAPRPGQRPSDAGAADAPAVPPMALALWGDPVIVAREPTRIPYNVMWIVVDALRPDVAAALHDPEEDARKLAAPHPPLDALLPVIPGLMPAIDRLATRAVHFTHAWSAASWTRPGTLAMLTGERSSELGIDTNNWVQPADRVAHYYASDPPLLPRLLRKSGATTAAFVNNFFMTGYANVGLDMGFERITDYRHRTRDTALITYNALEWLDKNAGARFFLFVNYNSPHEPYDPPQEMMARIPAPPAGPRDGEVRAYMAEAAKDDTGIGVLLDKLDALGLARSTLVVVSADHGETLSEAHDGFGLMGIDKVPMRFHHAIGNYEETTRVPIVMALPGVFDGGRAVRDRVRTIDIAPTILELEGSEADVRMSGRSFLSLVRGQKEAEPRIVVSEGRQSRAILWKSWRLIVHDTPAHPPAQSDGGRPLLLEDELFDLDDDPGERRNVARLHPDVVGEMRSRLVAALANAPAADAAEVPRTTALPAVHLRFAGAGRSHDVTGSLTVGDEKHPASMAIEPVGVTRDALRILGARVDFAFVTPPDGLLGFDVRIDPPGAPIVWQLFLDGAPWPDNATFVGPFGLPAVAARRGIATGEARSEVYAPTLPVIDPARDLGVFVTRDSAEKTSESASDAPAANAQAAKEMQRVLQDWGYAHGSH